MSELKGFEKAKTDRHRNKPLIATICLCLIGYGCNKNANLLQIVNGYFAFAQNVLKQCLEVFHQMGPIVSSETVRRSLQSNAVAILDVLVEKAATKRFLFRMTI